MSSSKAIIDKILSEAKAETDSILKDARIEAEEIIKKAKAEAEELKSKEISLAEASREDIERRKITVANLEVRKIMLSAKQKAINEAFDKALSKLTSLDKTKYKKLIFGMLKAEASDGDTVTIAKGDKDIITSDYINECGKKLKIKLKCSKVYGDFSGGILLSGSNYDKNMTLDVELSILRDEIEQEVYRAIFGDIK